MPYLNLDLDYFSHPKVMRLVGLLGPEYVALPIKLWCYVGKHHCADGALVSYSNAEVEAAVGWSGESGKMVEAMLKVGLLDQRDNGYLVHDWMDHAGHLVAFKKRAKSAAKKRWRKLATSIPHPASTDAPNHPSEPALLNHTKPIRLSERAKRLATLEAFSLTQELQDWARREFKILIPDDVLREFKNYWREKKNLHTDWDATFKNRIRQLFAWGVLKPGKEDVWGAV